MMSAWPASCSALESSTHSNSLSSEASRVRIRGHVPRPLRVITEDGELLCELTLDPSRDYQPQA